MRNSIIAVLVISALVAACGTPPARGGYEGAVPPRLTLQNNALVWDNFSTFGPLPDAKFAQGIEACKKLDKPNMVFQPYGYHSRARGLDGIEAPGGGFYCVPR